MADEQKDAPIDNPPVPRIQEESSSDDSSPEDNTSRSEKAREGGESSTDSPGIFEESGADSPDVPGAVGGNPEEPVAETEEELAEKARRLQIQATTLDKRGLHSGKVDVFRKFFNHDRLEFCTRPDGRQRHRAGGRQRHDSEGGLPPPLPLQINDEHSDLGSMVEDQPEEPSQDQNPGLGPLLNQAGAIVGVDRPADEFANLRGDAENPCLPIFGPVGDPRHSVTSAPTLPMAEAYAGIYSPEGTSSESDRGMGSGTSFPSFPSRQENTADSYVLKISPVPEYLRGACSRISPSSDSDNVPIERPARRRRFGVTSSHPIAIPSCSKSVDATSDPGDVPKRKISKDSSVDSSGERASSEDEPYPELLCQSVESESCVPIPDITAATECLQQGIDAPRAAAGMAPVGPVDAAGMAPVDEDRPQNVETEESESEQDPVTVLSCSPDAAKETEHPPRKDDA